ncbi:cell division protein [compost metagenome]
MLIAPDANCQIRLHQQALPEGCLFLINQYFAASQLQQDLHQLWLQTLSGLLPVAIHRDEAMAEALAAKQPLGEYRPESLAADEVLTLANWCLINLKDAAP